MEENVIIRHAVSGDETALAEIQAEAWEAAFGSIIFAMACSLLSGVISTALLAICRRKNGYD